MMITESIVSGLILNLVENIKEIREKRLRKKKKFFKALAEGLRIGSITTLDDVVNIYVGVAGLSSEDLNYRYGLSNYLREFLVILVSSEGFAFDDEAIRNFKQQVTVFIERNEEISPYSNLPSVERSILTDISAYLEHADIESTQRKFLELADLIKARNDTMVRIGIVNRFTIPLAVIALILSITFGILALL